MIIGPMNNYLSNEEIKNKPLRMDPTGDGFIGVVLDDGTFEPLKVSLETFTIIPNEAKNILANIESENIENNKSDVVYWTKSGKKYHSDPNCSGMKSPISGTIKESQRTPCSKCY